MSRWVGAVSALTIYLVLLFGFPALHQGWFVAWLFVVAFAVPTLMACRMSPEGRARKRPSALLAPLDVTPLCLRGAA